MLLLILFLIHSNSDLSAGSCSCTEEKVQQWWTVDLGDYYYVTQVQVLNRLTTTSQGQPDNSCEYRSIDGTLVI